jgi:hypothetical protein
MARIAGSSSTARTCAERLNAGCGPESAWRGSSCATVLRTARNSARPDIDGSDSLSSGRSIMVDSFDASRHRHGRDARNAQHLGLIGAGLRFVLRSRSENATRAVLSPGLSRLNIGMSASRCHAEKCAISARVLFGNAAIAPSFLRSTRSQEPRGYSGLIGARCTGAPVVPRSPSSMGERCQPI